MKPHFLHTFLCESSVTMDTTECLEEQKGQGSPLPLNNDTIRLIKKDKNLLNRIIETIKITAKKNNEIKIKEAI